MTIKEETKLALRLDLISNMIDDFKEFSENILINDDDAQTINDPLDFLKYALESYIEREEDGLGLPASAAAQRETP